MNKFLTFTLTLGLIVKYIFAYPIVESHLNHGKQRILEETANLPCSTIKDFPTQNQLTSHEAEAIALTCMDFRLLDDIVFDLDIEGYNNNYDQFILAGASLGYNAFSDWAKLFNNHVELAQKLHKISKIIVMDHENCGAYKLVFPDIDWKTIDANSEYQHHVNQLEKFAAAMKHYFPNISLEARYMHLNGTTIPVPLQHNMTYTVPVIDNTILIDYKILSIILGAVIFIFSIIMAIWSMTSSKKNKTPNNQGYRYQAVEKDKPRDHIMLSFDNEDEQD